MKEITLTQGKFVKVDNEDFEYLNQQKWYLGNHGYAVGYKNGKKILLHRYLLNTPKSHHTDHINGNKLDNQRENLRICNQTQNNRNTKKRINATSLFKGVSWNNESRKWQSQIYKNKNIVIGQFDSELHAAMAYDIWAKELFSKFAWLNF